MQGGASARQRGGLPGNPGAAPARPLKLALAMPGGFEFGGIGRMMMYATKAWGKGDLKPDWWTVDARGQGLILWSPLMIVREILGLVRRRPDLLHLNVAGRGSTLRKVILSNVAAALRIPTIVHLHDYDYTADFKRRSRATQWLVRTMFRRAAAVIVLGNRDRQIVLDLLDVPPGRVTVLHNAVPDPGPPPDRASRAGPIRLLFLGHLDDRKGVPELLRALARPALRERDWRLVLAGGGEVARFAAEVEASGLAERVELTGWLAHERVYELCRAADIFVLPSHAEGQAMSLLEAMAHGLAIVTTPVGAHLEAVRHDGEALIVQPGDVEALATALTRLIDDRETRHRLGAAARSRYGSDFDAVQYSKTLLKIYPHATRDHG